MFEAAAKIFIGKG